MIRIRSMRWRLQFWHGLLLATVLVAGGLTAYEYARAAMLGSTDAELDRRVGFFGQLLRGGPPPLRPGRGGPAGGMPEGPGGRPRMAEHLQRALQNLPPDEEATYSLANSEGWYYVVWPPGASKAICSENAPSDVSRPESADLRHPGPNHRNRGDAREAFLELRPGGVALVGHVMTADYARLHRYAGFLAAGCAAVLALGLLVGRWIVGRSLRPIRAITEAAGKIADGALSERIQTSDTDSELGTLARVLNETFARLESSFAQQARFTADAAHELRTPVSILLTHTENALSSPCEVADHREAFAACQRAAQRMRNLIESLLVLARLDSGQDPARRLSVDLAVRAAESIALLRPLAESRKIALTLDLTPAPCLADPDELDRVITNLAANAIQHNAEGGTARLSTFVDAGQACLVVSDSGPGIPPEHLSHVFERFYRADSSRSRASGGAGLGLAIAKAIVEAHRGSISVHSEPGHGATFTVRIPSEPPTSA